MISFFLRCCAMFAVVGGALIGPWGVLTGQLTTFALGCIFTLAGVIVWCAADDTEGGV